MLVILDHVAVCLAGVCLAGVCLAGVCLAWQSSMPQNLGLARKNHSIDRS